jgi:hypothetical protein
VTSLFDAVQPRRDVKAGELTEAQFAAGLEDVVAGSAADVYGDAATFFASTYPSSGLKTLLNEALGRLSGRRPSSASIIRLETSFGGGKTHNLIALYHAARGHLDRTQAAELMDRDLLLDEPIDQVGVFVGTESGATSFPTVAGVSARTLWGYLALQVGGSEGYELVRADDEALTAPGADALKRLFGDRPTLILIDEIARYYTAAKGHAVAGSTLAKQTTAFLMSLFQAVDSLPRSVLVITTTGSQDAFGDEANEIVEALKETRSLLARKELVLQPSEEADLPRILARRLFEPFASGVGDSVGQRYAETADAASSQGLDLPEAMIGAGWASEVARTYPFHPTLIRVLDKRLATIPNFQRTRGALRLLARVVRGLWEQRPPGVELIHLHHIDLADNAVAYDLSSRIDRALFDPVIRSDVASQTSGELSHAEQVDQKMGASYGRRLATAVYLYSLTREVPGVPASELYGAVLAPGDDPNLLVKALDTLEGNCWYLHNDLRGYRFSTEANLVRLIQEAETEVTLPKARARATKIFTEQFKEGTLKVKRAWEEARVPDNPEDAWLVLLHWDDFGDARGVDPRDEPPTKVKELFERTPTGGIREFRNRLVLLAPNASTHDAMVRAVRRLLALETLNDNSDRLASLTREKRKELKDKAKEAILEARVAVCNHTNVLYVPAANGLDVVELDTVSNASVRPNQSDAVLERLSAMEKTLVAGDKPLDPSYIKSKLGALFNTAQPTAELARAFARRTDLKMVLDRGELVKLIITGIRNGVWEYQNPERGDDGWATADRPASGVRLAEDTLLHPVGSAPAPKPLACPLCGKVHTGACPDEGGGSGGGDEPPPADSVFSATGAAGKAFADARANAAEAGRTELRKLHVAVEHLGAGADGELTRLHTLVSPTTQGVTQSYDIDLVATLGNVSETAEIHYHGSPGDYAPLREALKQLLRRHEATLHASITAIFDNPPELSGDVVGKIAQAASDTGPTKCTITLTTEVDT